MATVPTPDTQAASAVVTSTSRNLRRDALQFLLGSTMTGSGGGRRPLAQMRQTVAQSIPNNAWTAITLDTEDVDYDAGHSTSVNTDRYTAVTAGWYLVSGGSAWSANATGRRGVRYAVNGTAVLGSTSLVPASAAGTCAVGGRAVFVYLNAADILRCEVFQDSGGALLTSVVTDQESSLTVEWRSN